MASRCKGCDKELENNAPAHRLIVEFLWGETKVQREWKGPYCWDCFVDFSVGAEALRPPCPFCRTPDPEEE
jgi:hypothetical protein